MNKIAKFEKVSFRQFKEDWLKTMKNPPTPWTDEKIKEIYDKIVLPKRATKMSAGYDIFAPVDIYIAGGTYVNIPTGIRCKMAEGWVLTAYPRSGHGFKCGIRLANTVGVIDADYYNAQNEGHIFVKLGNESVLAKTKTVCVGQGEAFCQGIFLPFGITEDDEVENERIGGFGSTDKK